MIKYNNSWAIKEILINWKTDGNEMLLADGPLLACPGLIFLRMPVLYCRAGMNDCINTHHAFHYVFFYFFSNSLTLASTFSFRVMECFWPHLWPSIWHRSKDAEEFSKLKQSLFGIFMFGLIFFQCFRLCILFVSH